MILSISEFKLKRSLSADVKAQSVEYLQNYLVEIQRSIAQQCELRVKRSPYFNDNALSDSKMKERIVIDELKARNVDASYSPWTDPNRLRRSFS